MTLTDSRQHRRPRRRRGRDPRAWRVSPDDPRHPPGVPCPLPRWTAAGASVGCFPTACSLPRFPAGSASTTSLSRPAQASLALRPVGSLSRPRRPLSRGFDPPGCPDKPLVSYQINRQLPGWNLPPLVTRAVWAHWEIRDYIARDNPKASGALRFVLRLSRYGKGGSRTRPAGPEARRRICCPDFWFSFPLGRVCPSLLPGAARAGSCSSAYVHGSRDLPADLSGSHRTLSPHSPDGAAI